MSCDFLSAVKQVVINPYPKYILSMKKILIYSLLCLLPCALLGQSKEDVIQNIVTEAYQNSHLKTLGHQLLDDIGPRLVGTPQMREAHDWAVKKYESWGIPAEKQQWGKWQSWERGITHIDLVYPRTQTLSGMQLAWSPSTRKRGVTAELVVLPEIKDSVSFQKWLPTVKGKFVMIAFKQPTGRPDANWEKWATPESFKAMKTRRDSLKKAFRANIKRSGYTKRELIAVLEEAGAAGIVDSNWSKAFGANKIFGAHTEEIPTIDIQLEDYAMLYRMVEHGDHPKIHVTALSKDLGVAPTFNTIARIEGEEKPNEYVILSAHFDSWDGGTGATDNGTGTLLMMEVMRILKKVYPHPKRTILVGHWSSEEQGLNGSRAFVADHPEIVKNIQAVFNQDNGTGRIVRLNGSGFANSYSYLSRWLSAVPDSVSQYVETSFPGWPSTGGTDHSSFVAAGAPAFNLGALSWSYWNYTWHTNLDTYDKIVWSDLKNNVVLTAVLAYMASEDPQTTAAEKRVLPIDKATGEPQQWPEPRQPERRGGLD